MPNLSGRSGHRHDNDGGRLYNPPECFPILSFGQDLIAKFANARQKLQRHRNQWFQFGEPFRVFVPDEFVDDVEFVVDLNGQFVYLGGLGVFKG